MLVLSRRKGESVRIGDDIRLTLLDFSDYSARFWLEIGGKKAVLSRPMGSPLLASDQLMISARKGHRSRQLQIVVEAPKTIAVWREEIWLRMHAEQTEKGVA